MFKLDDNFLTELGLASLPPAEKNKMLSHIYETLEMKVGMRLAEKMSNEQLDEFEGYINSNDEQGALKWLETNFPNYKQVVAEELEKLKVEIRQVAPQIISQAAQQPLPDPAQSNNQATGQAPVPQQPQQFAQPSPHGAPAMQQGQSLAGGGTPGPYAPQQQQPYPSSPQPAHPGTPSSTAAYGASQPAQFQQPGTGAPAPPTPAPRGAAHSSLYPDPQSNGTPAAPAPQPQSPFPHQQPDPQLSSPGSMSVPHQPPVHASMQSRQGGMPSIPPTTAQGAGASQPQQYRPTATVGSPAAMPSPQMHSDQPAPLAQSASLPQQPATPYGSSMNRGAPSVPSQAASSPRQQPPFGQSAQNINMPGSSPPQQPAFGDPITTPSSSPAVPPTQFQQPTTQGGSGMYPAAPPPVEPYRPPGQ